MKIQAIRTKKQRMEPGKVYEVSAEVGEILIGKKAAIKAADNMQVGKVYDLKKPKKD